MIDEANSSPIVLCRTGPLICFTQSLAIGSLVSNPFDKARNTLGSICIAYIPRVK